ncbi:TPA: YcbK family protein [Pseudomonas aeruginosa]
MALPPTIISRRHFLAGLVAAPVVLATGEAVGSTYVGRHYDWRVAALSRDRWLDLERPDSREKSAFCYFRQGQGWDVRGYQEACILLRDVKYKATVRMSPKLLDLLFLIQVWLRVNRLPFRVLVNSGYRTPQHNSSLEGAAKQSLHIQAMAADIRIPGLSVDNLGRLAQAIGVGGVGFYPSKGFIHVDVGKVRTWRVAQGAELMPHSWTVERLDPGTDAQWLAGLAPEWPGLYESGVLA